MYVRAYVVFFMYVVYACYVFLLCMGVGCLMYGGWVMYVTYVCMIYVWMRDAHHYVGVMNVFMLWV